MTPDRFDIAANPADAALMEASLAAMDGSPVAAAVMRAALFGRFFAAFPARRLSFYNLDAAAPRMTDETVQMLLGLAAGERWVQGLVNELSFTHRQYGPLPDAEYDRWIDLTIDALRDAAGGWSADTDAAWRRQGERLKAIVALARRGWIDAMAPS